MKAFLGKEEVKEKYLDRLKAHAKADEIIKGQYWEDGKGCAVGCTIHSEDHMSYETELGIPVMLAKLEDGIFENLPNDLAMKWPLRFLSAINVGADLSMVGSKFLYWLLTDEKDGVIRFSNERTRASIVMVGDLYKQRLNGNEPNQVAWDAARDAAWDAAGAAARAAARAAAWDAARAAAWDAARAAAWAAAWDAAGAAARDAARAAAWAAAWDAAGAAARDAHYVKMADKLIELLKEAK